MFCRNCGEKISDEAMFCPNCGTKVIEDEVVAEVVAEAPAETAVEEPMEEVAEAPVEEPVEEVAEESSEQIVEENAEAATEEPEQSFIFCPECGAKNDTDAMFCGSCGYKFGEEVFSVVKEVAVEKQKKDNAKKTKIILACAGGAIVAVLALLAAFKLASSIFAGGDKSAEYKLYYVKDNAIYSAEARKYQPKLVSEGYLDDKDDSVNGTNFGKGPQFSNDGKYVFYLNDIEGTSGDLCFQKVGKPSTEEKLSSSVEYFRVLPTDKVIIKTSDRKLYVTDKKGNKEKITSEVSSYIVAKDGKKVIFTESDGSEAKLYSYDLSKSKSDKEKLATISDLKYASDDLKTVIYTKEDSLYVMKNLKDDEKIDSDVEEIHAYEDGNTTKIYYVVKKDVIKKSYYDFIEDDLYESDSKITEPMLENYQKTVTKDTFWGPRETVETDDSYYDDIDKYNEKLYRDNTRESLKNSTFELNEYEAFLYVEGSKEPVSVGTMLSTDSYSSGFNYVGKNVAILTSINLDDNSEKLKFSDVYEGKAYFNADQLRNTAEINLLYEDKLYTVDPDELNADLFKNNIYFTSVDDDIYCTVTADNYKDLYKVEIGKDKIKYESLDTDVDEVDIYTLKGGYITLADKDRYGAGDLRVNGEKVATDVYEVVSILGSDDQEIAYITDYKDGEGTLNIYNAKSGKSVKADDEVYIAGNNGIYKVDNNYAYLVDYSERYGTGDLIIFDGKEAKKIDTDVSGICYDYSAEYDEDK